MKHDPRKALVDYYKLLREYGLNDSHSGNASVRDGDTIWVTPTGCCADTLQADDLVACHINGDPAPGASLDAAMHVMVYRKNSSAGAVLHSHNPHTLAMTMDGEDFVPIDFEGAYYFGTVPVIDEPYENYIAESARLISNVLRDHKVTVYRGHGIYVQGETLNLAYKWTSSLELSAKIAWLARVAGTHPRN